LNLYIVNIFSREEQSITERFLLFLTSKYSFYYKSMVISCKFRFKINIVESFLIFAENLYNYVQFSYSKLYINLHFDQCKLVKCSPIKFNWHSRKCKVRFAHVTMFNLPSCKFLLFQLKIQQRNSFSKIAISRLGKTPKNVPLFRHNLKLTMCRYLNWHLPIFHSHTKMSFFLPT